MRPISRPLMVAASAALCLLAIVPAAQARHMSTTYVTSLTPKTATKPIGVNHTVTATVIRQTENCDPKFGPMQTGPAAGKTVKFAVVSGPNKGQGGTATTDPQGHAHFTYTSQKTGTDRLVATPVSLVNKGICNADPGPAAPSGEVEANWIPGRDGEDDPPPVEGCSPLLSIDDVRVIEGDDEYSPATHARFTVSLSGPCALPVTVDYATADGSATDAWDYKAQHDKLTFAPGELAKAVTIDVRGDHLDEADETFAVALSNPWNAQISDGKGIGTIDDDDDVLIP